MHLPIRPGMGPILTAALAPVPRSVPGSPRGAPERNATQRRQAGFHANSRATNRDPGRATQQRASLMHGSNPVGEKYAPPVELNGPS